jgi:hypothetical protein
VRHHAAVPRTSDVFVVVGVFLACSWRVPGVPTTQEIDLSTITNAKVTIMTVKRDCSTWGLVYLDNKEEGIDIMNREVIMVSSSFSGFHPSTVVIVVGSGVCVARKIPFHSRAFDSRVDSVTS